MSQQSGAATAILGTMRLPFLILPPACVLLGTATAVWSGAKIDWVYLLVALVGAVCAHISVNALNEYSDFKSGLDLKTEPTPFSGGSGTLPKNPEKAPYALLVGVVTLLLTIAAGLFFLAERGAWLLPLGVLGLVTVVAYTDLITRNPFLCLIAPGLGFGPLMVMGTHFVLAGSYSWTAFIASLVPFFLVSDLLLLNQFPDLEADRGVGRKHVPITLGRDKSAKIYALFLAGAYLTPVIGYFAGVLPLAGLLALGTIVLAVPNIMGVTKNANDIPKLVPYMGKNVVLNIATPVLLAIGLFIG